MVLREADYAFDLESVDLAKKQTASGEDYTRINSKGYVPALTLDRPRLKEYVARMAARPAVQEAISAEGLRK